MELLPPADIKCINPLVMTVLTHVGHLLEASSIILMSSVRFDSNDLLKNPYI